MASPCGRALLQIKRDPLGKHVGNCKGGRTADRAAGWLYLDRVSGAVRLSFQALAAELFAG